MVDHHSPKWEFYLCRSVFYILVIKLSSLVTETTCFYLHHPCLFSLKQIE